MGVPSRHHEARAKRQVTHSADVKLTITLVPPYIELHQLFRNEAKLLSPLRGRLCVQIDGSARFSGIEIVEIKDGVVTFREVE